MKSLKNKYISQNGFAHLVIVAVLFTAMLGVVGVVGYQSLNKKEVSAAGTTSKKFCNSLNRHWTAQRKGSFWGTCDKRCKKGNYTIVPRSGWDKCEKDAGKARNSTLKKHKLTCYTFKNRYGKVKCASYTKKGTAYCVKNNKRVYKNKYKTVSKTDGKNYYYTTRACR